MELGAGRGIFMKKGEIIKCLREMESRLQPAGIYIENSHHVRIDNCQIKGFPTAIKSIGSSYIDITRTDIQVSTSSIKQSIEFMREIRTQLEKQSPDEHKLRKIIDHFQNKVAPEVLKAVLSALISYGISWIRK